MVFYLLGLSPPQDRVTRIDVLNLYGHRQPQPTRCTMSSPRLATGCAQRTAPGPVNNGPSVIRLDDSPDSRQARKA